MVDHYTAFNEKMVASLAAGLPRMMPATTKGFLTEKTKEPIPQWAIDKLKEAKADNWEAVISDLLETATT
jgi:hypothetical protein